MTSPTSQEEVNEDAEAPAQEEPYKSLTSASFPSLAGSFSGGFPFKTLGALVGLAAGMWGVNEYLGDKTSEPVPVRALREPVGNPPIIRESSPEAAGHASTAEAKREINTGVEGSPDQHSLSEDQARQSLPHQFLGVKEWKMVFQEEVAPASELPPRLTPELLRGVCPISADGNPIAATHQAILVPGGLSLEKLERLCKESGLDFVLDDSSMRNDPALKEAAPSSYWAFTVEAQTSSSPFVKGLIHKSDIGQIGLFNDKYPSHKVNNVREAVLSILLARSNPMEPCPSITVMCAERDVAGRYFAVQYNAESKEIVIGTTTSFPQATISPGLDLEKGL
jgi:hypothetical protein